MFRKSIFRFESNTEVRLADDDQSGHSEPATLPSEWSESASGVRRDSNASMPSSPLGLHIVHQPDQLSGDIVFVHGLGGSSYKTWTWNRDDPDSFWPAWLPDCDPSLANFRISTFGYNAKFKGSASNLDIIDFAKDLLLELSAAFDVQDQSRARPIIFIVHSLGGLVIKKAYTLGKHDEQYKNIAERIRGMIFLSTPHRGTQYAKTLNNILSAAPIGTSAKSYVAALALQSSTIQDINENFRIHCQDVNLCSVFETQKTPLSVSKILLVERDSAILGYPKETSFAMDADHHSICKYKDRHSTNFGKIKSILLRWATEFLSQYGPPVKLASSNPASVESNIHHILGIENPFDEPNASLSNQDTPVCGTWLTENISFKEWMTSAEPSVFMLVGVPGTGKTAISHAIVERLRTLDIDSQYHFFDESNQQKRAASYCLRRIAAQLAITDEEFRSALFKQHEQSGAFMTGLNQNLLALWDRLFGDLLSRLQKNKTMFWVIDGLDEADMPLPLLSKLTSLPDSLRLKVFVSCRPLKGVSTQDNSRIIPYTLKPGDTTRDMEQFVNHAVEQALPGDQELQEFVRTTVLKKASGSFLWARLALDMMQESWHTHDDIVAALTEVPNGMSAIYARMLRTVQDQNPKTRELARHILLWVACSWRPLLLTELQEALKPDFGRLINLSMTISHICGNFVMVDNSDASGPTASLIHITAKDFLLRQDHDSSHWIDAKLAHERITKTLLSYLCNDNWRRHFGSSEMSPAANQVFSSPKKEDRLAFSSKKFPLLSYATYHWAYHFSKCPVPAPDLMEVLENFLLNYSLTWIEGIALTANMTNLIHSAQYMRAYIKRCTRNNATGSHWIQLWATDFIRIASKFAENLILNPASIHRNVPQMCPVTSMIRRTFSLPSAGALRVMGTLPDTWDDCIGTVSMVDGDAMTQVVASEIRFLTLTTGSGKVSLWSTATCEHIRTLEHGESVSRMALSLSGARLVTVSFTSYSVWEVLSGKPAGVIPREKGARILDIRFSMDEKHLIIAKPDGCVEFVGLDAKKIERTARPDLYGFRDQYNGCPWRAAISPDATQIASLWRGKAPMIYNIEKGADSGPMVCRTTGQGDALMYAEQLAWRADTGSLLILCNNTNLVEWRIFSDEIIEFPIKARDMSVSGDGSTLITCDHKGTINIHTFPHLGLIYSLRNSGAPATALLFAPDNQRFYDVRGSSCNVREPEALVRPDDPDLEEASSYTGSFAPTEPVIADFVSEDADITAIVASPDHDFFVCGRKDGSVSIHSTELGCKVRSVAQHKTAVTKLAWSPSGKYIVSCDSSSSVIVKKVSRKEDGGGRWAVFRWFELHLSDPARQVVFCAAERHVLVASQRRDWVWDLKKKVQLHSRSRNDQKYRHWMPDPSHPGTLLRVGPSGAAYWDLDTGEELGEMDAPEEPKLDEDGIPIPEPETLRFHRGRELPSAILWSCAVDSGRHRLVALSTYDRPYRTAFHFGVKLKLIPLNPGSASQIDLGTATAVPREVTIRIKLLLGVIGNKLLFLGVDGWIQSYDLSQILARSNQPVLVRDRIQGLSRHFYVPKNWLNDPRAHLIRIGSNGVLLCPLQGGVAIVKNGLRI